jgi:RNA polymerase sigma-70 factor (ECF subfamily)
MYESNVSQDVFVLACKGQAEAVRPDSVSSEELIIESVRAGNREHFARLYQSYAPMVHGILLARVPPGEVEDLLQDIFLHALKKLHTLRDSSAFGPWIAMIARNRAMDFHRRSRKTEGLDEEMPGVAPASTKATEVLGLVGTLPEAYRETLVLRLVEGMTGPEIASRTGLTAASVRVNLHRGMKMLREKLGEKELA